MFYFAVIVQQELFCRTFVSMHIDKESTEHRQHTQGHDYIEGKQQTKPQQSL